MLWHAVVSRQYARALRFLGKLSEEKFTREVDLKAAEISRLLDWTHVETFLLNQLPTKYPTQYRRF